MYIQHHAVDISCCLPINGHGRRMSSVLLCPQLLSHIALTIRLYSLVTDLGGRGWGGAGCQSVIATLSGTWYHTEYGSSYVYL